MEFDLKNYFYFIFDFDGVIVESVDIKTEAFAQLYRPFGEEVVSRVVSHHLSHGGLSRFEKIRLYHKDFLDREISQVEIDELAEQFSKIVFEKVIRAPFVKGVVDFLKLLEIQGKKMFLLSATPEDEIKAIATARKITSYFQEMKGSPKSKQDNLGLLIKKHRIESEKAIYFGDSAQDLQAASFFGINFVPINYVEPDKGFRDFAGFMETTTKGRG